LGGEAAAELQGLPAEATWDETDWQKIPGQIEDVLQIVSIAEPANHIVQDELQVIFPMLFVSIVKKTV
jgi:hypothetical protein